MKALPAALLAVSIVATFLIAAPGIHASSLTLDTGPGVNTFNASNHLVSGAVAAGIPPQPASYEAVHHADVNGNGTFDGPDGFRRSIGSYDNGLFRLYSSCLSLGAFNSAHQYVRTVGHLVIDDVMVTTSNPSPPTAIPTSLSFHASGGTSHYNNPNWYDLITAQLDMLVSINGSVFTGTYAWNEFSGGVTTDTVSGLGTQIAGGVFAHAFSQTVVTGQASIPVNTPFTVEIKFVVSAGAGGGSWTAYGGLTFDARNTLGFLPGVQVFNDLPAGYTVSAPSVGLTENMFGASPVPVQPATWSQIKRLHVTDTP